MARAVSAFARRQFLEFTFKAEYAYDSGMPQWMARVDHSFSGLHLERLFLGWHKFSHFRGVVPRCVGGVCPEGLARLSGSFRPYVQRSRMEAMVEGHLKGDRNHTNNIHLLLTLELTIVSSSTRMMRLFLLREFARPR